MEKDFEEKMASKELKGLKDQLKERQERRVFSLQELRKKDFMGFRFENYFDFDSMKILFTKGQKMYRTHEDIPEDIRKKMKEVSKKYLDGPNVLEENIQARLEQIKETEKGFKGKMMPGSELFSIALAYCLTENMLDTKGQHIKEMISHIFSVLSDVINVQKEMLTTIKKINEKQAEIEKIRSQTHASAAETFTSYGPKQEHRKTSSHDSHGPRESNVRPLSLDDVVEELEMYVGMSSQTRFGNTRGEKIGLFMEHNLGFHAPIIKNEERQCIITLTRIYLRQQPPKEDIRSAIHTLEMKNIINSDTGTKIATTNVIKLLKGYLAHLE